MAGATQRIVGGLILGLCLASPSAARADAYYAPSPYRPIRLALAQANRDLAKTLGELGRDAPTAALVKDAEAAVANARRDYSAATVAARQSLAADPHVGPLQKDVATLQKRLRDQGDANVRLAIAGELMQARNRLNTAEWEILGVDPDIAVGRAAIDDAKRQLQEAQSKHATAVQGDASVTSLKQRILGLRRQLRNR